MIYIDKKFLSIYESDSPIDSISLGILEKLLIRKTNNVIYFTSNDILYGIVTSGDIGRAVRYGLDSVSINYNFTKIYDGRYMQALEILKENHAINALPIVGNDGRLLAEYNRRDAILPLREGLGLEEGIIDEISSAYKRIAIIICDEHVNSKKQVAEEIRRLLVNKCETVEVICVEKVLETYKDYDICITLDEDDSTGIGALAAICGKEDFFYKKNKVYTETMELAEAMERTLMPIKNEGINIVNVFTCPETNSARKFRNRIHRKYSSFPRNGLVTNELANGFFQDLNSEEYRIHIGNENDLVLKVKEGMAEIEDINSKYRNYKRGERLTIGQPEKPDKTIYFFGQCFIRGAFVEDKDTIESILQKKLNGLGYNIKVVNYGDCDPLCTLRRIRKCYNERRIESGDIIVTCIGNSFLPGIMNLNLVNNIDFNNMSEAWFTDDFFHCNRKVNDIYAKEILSCLMQSGWLDNEKIKKQSEMKLPEMFLFEKYFVGMDLSRQNIGSIVMNCNPFTYGHRYLIEQSAKQVDWLIIFVVSEDKSLFSFNSRYAMVKSGTRDLKNVIVIPSGDIVLSQRNFPEYFIKSVDEETEKNAEKDVEIFAREIASNLNIHKRFVGAELTDEVTRHYNEAMKRVLPKYGIELIEIPRKEIDGKAISATIVREALLKNDMKKLKMLCPQSTLDIMFWRSR